MTAQDFLCKALLRLLLQSRREGMLDCVRMTKISILLIAFLCVMPAAAQEKVILDSDYTTIGDDGQVGVMAMQLHAQGVVNLLAITVVAGNNWMTQGVCDVLRAVVRMGLDDSVGV